jgi:hypothetical protein
MRHDHEADHGTPKTKLRYPDLAEVLALVGKVSTSRKSGLLPFHQEKRRATHTQ